MYKMNTTEPDCVSKVLAIARCAVQFYVHF